MTTSFEQKYDTKVTWVAQLANSNDSKAMTYKVTLLRHKYWKQLTKEKSMNSEVMTEVVSVLTIGKLFKGDSMQMCFVQRRLMC